MSVEKVSTILKMADEANTTAIAFNCTDYNTIVSVVKVAEELSKPVICMLYPEHAYLKHWTTPKIFVETVRDVAKNVKVPVGIHLDHCSDFDYIVAAMRCGFDSIMYDGSMLPVEENIKNTAEIVKVAKAFGADVEAELGRVGFASTVADQNDTDKYTKPEVAAAFCEQSGCSSVAVAIGSAHGFYKETPKLDIERLKKINAATDVPLVLHGGSGIPNDQLEVAFREGINKFNVGTEFFYLYYQTMKKFCEAGHPDFFDLPLEVQNALENYLRQKMQLSKFQA
ncbi:MAG: class II fructose-bisphosphate aldolase [Christensenellales bacterium]|jgi:fructose-bisphosphate aldolase class II